MRDNGAKYGIDVSRFDKTADAVQAVGIGRLAAYMTTAPSALWMVKTQKAFSANVIVPTGGYFALPFRKDDAAFRDMVDDNLKCMKQDGTLAKIYEKWFGVAPTAASAIVKVFPGHGAQGWPGYIANAPEPKCF
jgi:polar amino acid transport system substrate-binding protein